MLCAIDQRCVHVHVRPQEPAYTQYHESVSWQVRARDDGVGVLSDNVATRKRTLPPRIQSWC